MVFSLIKVSGDSMSPALQDGDLILAKTIKPRSLRPGFIYVVNHGDLGTIIKRLGPKSGERYMLIGDNPNSTPSAVMGPVGPSRINRRALIKLSRGVKVLR